MAKNLEYRSLVHVLPLFLQLSLKFPLIGVLWQRLSFFCCVLCSPHTSEALVLL